MSERDARDAANDANDDESDGNASFLRAARDGNIDEVLDYLKGSTDINTSNAHGLNALHLASKEGHIKIVTELIKRGADVDAATKKGNTSLHIASLAGHYDIVQTLVENGAQVNLQALAGFTPLYMASQEGKVEVVKFLLSSGANQGLSTEDGFTPLAVALQQGHERVVTVLLEHDAKGKVRLPALHIAAKKDDVKSAALLLQNEQNSTELQNKGGLVNDTTKSGFTPLHIASHYGNTNVANLLIERSADVNFKAKNNITPLHVASRWGKLNMVTLLLNNHAIIDEKTRDGLCPLHCAARSGHDSVVDLLLDMGAPHSAKTKNGLTPLHMASQGDHVDCARLLLYHKASLNEVTIDYLTPLHVASHCGNVKTAKLLLDRKCEPNARALNGFTPLHIACKKNRIKVVELLLKYGASIESKTESGLSPLHVASFMGHMNIVIYLIQHNALPNTATVRGETALHLAARANQSDIIRILLRNGATVDATAREQQTPLHIVARLGNVDNVVLLLQHGAKVDATTKDKYTPLHIAAKEGHEEVAQVLLENEAQHDITTKKGFTPLHIAAKYGNIKVARMLLQKDANPDVQGKNGLTPLHVATHYNHSNVAQLLLESKANPHATAKNGYTPLHIAAKKNQMEIATMLLEYGAKANAESKNGFTPLHLAAQEGHTDIVALLLEKEASVNSKAHNGLTPMHLAAQEDKVAVAEILVKFMSETDSSTKAGYTPLHTACHFGQMNMVRFLLDHDASVNATTKVGYTPLHQAAQQGHVQVVSLLLKHQASPNAVTNNGQTSLAIAQKLGYISVVEILKPVTEIQTTLPVSEDKYKVVSPETMQETFISDSEDEGGNMSLSASPYERHFLTDDDWNRSPRRTRRKHRRGEDSISIERGGSSSPLDTSFDKDIQQRYPTQDQRGRIVSHIGASMYYPSYLENAPDYEEEMRYYHGETLSPKDKNATLDKSRTDSVFGDYSTLGRDSLNLDTTSNRDRQSAASTGDLFEDDDIFMKKAKEDPLFSEDLYARNSFRYGRQPPRMVAAGRTPQSTEYRDQSREVVYQGHLSSFGSISENPTFPPDDSAILAADAVEEEQMVSASSARTRCAPPTPATDYMDAQITSQTMATMYSAPPPISGGPRLPTATTEGGNRFSSYSGSSFSTSFDPDNVPVDRSPVYSGFLISFMVDARGGAMRGCRHPGVRIIIPPRKCSMPTRVTCRLVKKEKLSRPPPMLEGEGLAARVLEMGPVGSKFLGPVLIEVPHFASLRGREREVVILRSDNGENWYEHPMQATEDAVTDALGTSAEELDPEEVLANKRIKRILTSDLPMYFALVSRVTRVKQESTVIGMEGGVLSSTVVPQVQAVLPEGTLTRPIPVGLQAQPIAPELVAKLLGNRVAVSPIVTIEPRRRKFHKPITLTVPVPRAAQKGMINQYGQERPTLRLLFSLAADPSPAQWEDVTDSKPMTLVDDCVSFTTTVSARFWLIDCQNVHEASQMASLLYQEAVTVPYMAKFVVFAKRDAPEEGKLRIFCMTDDKDDKTLEKQEKFFEVARSRDIEVLEGRPQFVEMAGNLIPVTKSGDQLHVNFRAFRENRLPCTVKIRDQDQSPSARIAFMKEPKVARGEAPQTPICNLNFKLPDMVTSDSGDLDPEKAAELRKHHDFLRAQGIVIQDSVNRAEMKLSDIADTLQGDWIMLAQQLKVPMSEINHIKTDYKTVGDQAMAMLHYWVEKNGDKATGNELETALRRINREDVIRKCMRNVERVDDEMEAAAARVAMDQSGFDTFSEEVGINKDRKGMMGREMSLDVQYDEQDMIKESESAGESPASDKAHISGIAPQASQEVSQRELFSDDDALIEAAIDMRRPQHQAVTKTVEELDEEQKQKQQAYLDLAAQMDAFAEEMESRSPHQVDGHSGSSIDEDQIVASAKQTDVEAYPALREGYHVQPADHSKVTFAADVQEHGDVDEEEGVHTPPPSPTDKKEPVQASDVDVVEAAARLASHSGGSGGFESEDTREDDEDPSSEVMYSRAELSGLENAATSGQEVKISEPSKQITSPVSEGSNFQDEPSPVPEPTLPEGFIYDEMAYDKPEDLDEHSCDVSRAEDNDEEHREQCENGEDLEDDAKQNETFVVGDKEEKLSEGLNDYLKEEEHVLETQATTEVCMEALPADEDEKQSPAEFKESIVVQEKMENITTKDCEDNFNSGELDEEFRAEENMEDTDIDEENQVIPAENDGRDIPIEDMKDGTNEGIEQSEVEKSDTDDQREIGTGKHVDEISMEYHEESTPVVSECHQEITVEEQEEEIPEEENEEGAVMNEGTHEPLTDYKEEITTTIETLEAKMPVADYQEESGADDSMEEIFPEDKYPFEESHANKCTQDIYAEKLEEKSQIEGHAQNNADDIIEEQCQEEIPITEYQEETIAGEQDMQKRSSDSEADMLEEEYKEEIVEEYEEDTRTAQCQIAVAEERMEESPAKEYEENIPTDKANPDVATNEREENIVGKEGEIADEITAEQCKDETSAEEYREEVAIEYEEKVLVDKVYTDTDEHKQVVIEHHVESVAEENRQELPTEQRCEETPATKYDDEIRVGEREIEKVPEEEFLEDDSSQFLEDDSSQTFQRDVIPEAYEGEMRTANESECDKILEGELVEEIPVVGYGAESPMEGMCTEEFNEDHSEQKYDENVPSDKQEVCAQEHYADHDADTTLEKTISTQEMPVEDETAVDEPTTEKEETPDDGLEEFNSDIPARGQPEIIVSEDSEPIKEEGTSEEMFVERKEYQVESCAETINAQEVRSVPNDVCVDERDLEQDETITEGRDLSAAVGDELSVDRREETMSVHTPTLHREQTPEQLFGSHLAFVAPDTTVNEEEGNEEKDDEPPKEDETDGILQGNDEELQTHRVMMKKEVHKKTILGADGQEHVTIQEDSQVQQDNEPPEELRESMQDIINQFMESDPSPPRLEDGDDEGQGRLDSEV